MLAIHYSLVFLSSGYRLIAMHLANWHSNIRAVFSCILQILFLNMVLPHHVDMSLYKSPLPVFCTFCLTYTCTVLLRTSVLCHANTMSLFYPPCLIQVVFNNYCVVLIQSYFILTLSSSYLVGKKQIQVRML